MRKIVLSVFMILLLGFQLTAQNHRVSGTVTDQEGNPMVGVAVILKGTSVAAVTNIDGLYAITVPANGILEFSYLGMLTQEIPVSSRSVINVTLEPALEVIENVVVVGYGTQRKQDVTSSIARVGGADISNLAGTSFESQLAGRAAGVQVINSSGVVGYAPEFQIRGYSTISSGSQPLIVINGVPVTSGQVQMIYGRYNPMADINPNDIESVEILKDGAATAIYGSRAANGVVLITTKSGSKSRGTVSYEGYVGWASPAKLHKLLNADQFKEITDELYNIWEMTPQAVNDGTNTNWNDYIYQTGFQHNHSISLSGSTDKAQYYASVGYGNQEGIIRNSMQERFTANLNASQQANKWLRIGVNSQASRTTLNGVMNQENSLASVGFASVRMLPNVSVFNSNDPTGYNIDADNRKALGRGSNLSHIENNLTNVVWSLDNNLNRSQNTRLLASAFGEITFMEGLTFRTQGGMDLSLMNDFMRWHPASGDGASYSGILEEVNTTFYNWNWQNVLNFNRSFGLHNVNATAVQEYTKEEYRYVDASIRQISDPFYLEHIISNSFGDKGVGGYKTETGLASYMLRANYNYDSKYYIGASVRRDGLSKLPPDTRWGTFWGASAAWRISRENFWQNSSVAEWFDDFRVRASYATIGNSNLSGNFPYMGTYGAIRYGGQNGIRWDQMGNDLLKWESTATYDIGIDGSMFGGRLNFEVTYFNKATRDLVLSVPVAPSMGIPYDRYSGNVGKMENSGFEFTVSGRPVATKNFSWQVDFNFTTIKNRVVELVDHADMEYTYNINREGESFMSLYGYEFYGINNANGNAIWVRQNEERTLVQFDLERYNYFVYDPNNPNDLSQVSTLSSASDRKILGGVLPTWYGGLSNTFTYKGFDLNIFLRFSGGNYLMNATMQESLLNTDFANKGEIILGRWQSPEKPGNGIIPRLGYGDDTYLFNTGVADSRFVEKADYLKVGNITLGYTFPSNWTSKLGISRVRVYAQAQNVMTITGYSGLDPETTSRRGVDWDGLPQQKAYTFGINITF